eukprot:gene8728-5627_t
MWYCRYYDPVSGKQCKGGSRYGKRYTKEQAYESICKTRERILSEKFKPGTPSEGHELEAKIKQHIKKKARRPTSARINKWKDTLRRWKTMTPLNSGLATQRITAAERKDKAFLRGLVQEIAVLDLFKNRSRADYKFVAVSADRPPTWQLLRKRARLNTLKLKGRALQYK